MDERSIHNPGMCFFLIWTWEAQKKIDMSCSQCVCERERDRDRDRDKEIQKSEGESLRTFKRKVSLRNQLGHMSTHGIDGGSGCPELDSGDLGFVSKVLRPRSEGVRDDPSKLRQLHAVINIIKLLFQMLSINKGFNTRLENSGGSHELIDRGRRIGCRREAIGDDLNTEVWKGQSCIEKGFVAAESERVEASGVGEGDDETCRLGMACEGVSQTEETIDVAFEREGDQQRMNLHRH
ncbi:hypothetical protein L7F22_001569 [Adiantum nelumboides]|nr:hypothetical protein [Adiantum nelumboides]